MNLLALTGISGPAGIFGPGGISDLTAKDKPTPAATVAPPVAVSAAGISPTLLAAGAGLVVLVLALRR